MAKLTGNGKVYGIDLSEKSVRSATRKTRNLIKEGRVELHQGNVSKLPFEDNTFTKVTTFVSFHYWTEPKNDCVEIFRTLKPGGKFFLVNNNYEDELFKERNERWRKMYGCKIYSIKEYISFLRDAGFTNLEHSLDKEKNWIVIIGVKKR